MKFKVGDKIVGNKKASVNYGITVEGWTGIVTAATDYDFEAHGIGKYKDPTNYTLSYECFDLLEQEVMSKRKLLALPLGTKITTDAEDDNVYFKYDDDSFENGMYCIDECDIEDDLTLNDEDLGKKIIKVEVPKEYETVYELKNVVKEMTLKEVCDKLGYQVKIIKED